MERLAVALALAVVVVIVAWLIGRRSPQAPTQRQWAVPDQLNRADFERPGAPLLLAVFSSANCQSCRQTIELAQGLASADVVVQDVEVSEERDLHKRYNIEAVPTLVVADREGVVRASYVGPPPPDELTTALKELLEA